MNRKMRRELRKDKYFSKNIKFEYKKSKRTPY